MLRKALAELPPTLDETYNRILCAIDNDHSTHALRILQWLAFSARPLLIEEVAEVVAIDPERDPAFDQAVLHAFGRRLHGLADVDRAEIEPHGAGIADRAY